ncbi:MAG: hypothetical protein QXW35_03630 [Candidatus Aenigmatarchaeota archaeon]
MCGNTYLFVGYVPYNFNIMSFLKPNEVNVSFGNYYISGIQSITKLPAYNNITFNSNLSFYNLSLNNQLNAYSNITIKDFYFVDLSINDITLPLNIISNVVNNIDTIDFTYNSMRYNKPVKPNVSFQPQLQDFSIYKQTLLDVNIPEMAFDLKQFNYDLPDIQELCNLFTNQTSINTISYYSFLGFNKLNMSVNSFDNYISKFNNLLYKHLTHYIDNITTDISNFYNYHKFIFSTKNLYFDYLTIYNSLASNIKELRINLIKSDYDMYIQHLNTQLNLDKMETLDAMFKSYINLYETYRSAFNSYLRGLEYNYDTVSNIKLINSKIQLIKLKNDILKMNNDILIKFNSLNDFIYSYEKNVIPVLINKKQELLSDMKNLLVKRKELILLKQTYLLKEYQQLVSKTDLLNTKIALSIQQLKFLPNDLNDKLFNEYISMFEFLKSSKHIELENYSNIVKSKILNDYNRGLDVYLSSLLTMKTNYVYVLNNMKQYYNVISSLIYSGLNAVLNIQDVISNVYTCSDLTISITRMFR